MADAKARASGPLFAQPVRGRLGIGPVWSTRISDLEVPCRLLPGHGRWVPAELVARIEVALRPRYETEEERWERVWDAIRAAKEGEV